MKKFKAKKKAFTLTELIIVIAIIAILAAVLIPSITGYVNKAKLSNDTVNAKNMSLTLQTESIFDEVDCYDIDEVENILTREGYNLSSTAKGYSYWYDRATNKVVVAKTQDEISKDYVANSSKLSSSELVDDGKVKLDNSTSAYKRDTIECLSSYHPQYQYLDKKDDVLTDLVSTLRDLVEKNYDETTKIINEDAMLEMYKGVCEKTLNKYKKNNDNLKSFIEEFNLNNTIYVDEYGSVLRKDAITFNYTTNYTTGVLQTKTKTSNSYVSIIKHIVYSKNITSIGPSNKQRKGYPINGVVIPKTVKYIANNSFLGYNISNSPSMSGFYFVLEEFTEQNGVETYFYGNSAKSYICPNFRIEIPVDTIFLNENELSALNSSNGQKFIKINYYENMNNTSSIVKLSSGFGVKFLKYDISYISNSKVSYKFGVTSDDLETEIQSIEESGKVLKVTASPSLALINEKDGGVIDFSKIEKCVTKSVIHDNYIQYVFAIYCDGKKYKAESIGIVTNINIINNLYFVYSNSEYKIKNENFLNIEEDILNLYGCDNLQIKISYDGNNAVVVSEDKVSTDKWIEGKNYIDTEKNSEDNKSSYVTLDVNDFNNKDINEILKNDLKEKYGVDFNNISIKKVEIIDKDYNIIFIQSY